MLIPPDKIIAPEPKYVVGVVFEKCTIPSAFILPLIFKLPPILVDFAIPHPPLHIIAPEFVSFESASSVKTMF